MQNDALVTDHLKRCQSRIKSIAVLMEDKSWADVVRESQEVVELCLKALLRAFKIDAPRIHDVSEILHTQKQEFPKNFREKIDKISKISRDLRRDRDLAFYGSEDLTPSEFYKEEDALEAYDGAKWIVSSVREVVLK